MGSRKVSAENVRSQDTKVVKSTDRGVSLCAYLRRSHHVRTDTTQKDKTPNDMTPGLSLAMVLDGQRISNILCLQQCS